MVSRFSLLTLVLTAIISSPAAASAGAEEPQLPWTAAKPVSVITLIQPGSPADLELRGIALRLEDRLNQRFYLDYYPASQSDYDVEAVRTAYPDGYTIGAGQTEWAGTENYQDWSLYVYAADPAVVALTPDSGLESFDELVDALAAETDAPAVSIQREYLEAYDPLGQIAGHYEIILAYEAFDTYDEVIGSEGAALVAPLSVIQAAVAEGRISPVAVLFDRDIEMQNHGQVTSIVQWVEDHQPVAVYHGIWVLPDVPAEVRSTYEMIWDSVTANRTGTVLVPVAFFGESTKFLFAPEIEEDEG